MMMEVVYPGHFRDAHRCFGPARSLRKSSPKSIACHETRLRGNQQLAHVRWPADSGR